MKSITIACTIANEVKYGTGNTGSTIAEVVVSITTGYGDKAITGTATCVAYGKAADAVRELPSSNVIVTGDMEISKDRTLKINNARFFPGLPGLELNQASIAGNTGREPEVQRFESGNMVAKVGVAVRRSKDVTDWFNCEVWGKQAQIMEAYVGKGNQVGMVGQIKAEQWRNKTTGAMDSGWKFTIDRVSLLGKRSDGEASNGMVNRSQELAPTSTASRTHEDDDF